MRKKHFAVGVIGFMLIISSWGGQFAYADGPAPVVSEMPGTSHPAVPTGMKVTCLKGPDTLDPCSTCPVLQWCGVTYWAYSYIDNRVGMGIVAYDASGNILQQWERKGVRYVYKITVDNTARIVTFWGQANQTIVMAWNEFGYPW